MLKISETVTKNLPFLICLDNSSFDFARKEKEEDLLHSSG